MTEKNWQLKFAESAYLLIQKQNEIDSLRRQSQAADAKLKRVHEICDYFNEYNLRCQADGDGNNLCKLQCLAKGKSLTDGKILDIAGLFG